MQKAKAAGRREDTWFAQAPHLIRPISTHHHPPSGAMFPSLPRAHFGNQHRLGTYWFVQGRSLGGPGPGREPACSRSGGGMRAMMHHTRPRGREGAASRSRRPQASRGNKCLHPLLHTSRPWCGGCLGPTSCRGAATISGPLWGTRPFPSTILTERPGPGLGGEGGTRGSQGLAVPSTPCLGRLPPTDQPSILSPGRQSTGPGPCQSAGAHEA